MKCKLIGCNDDVLLDSIYCQKHTCRYNKCKNCIHIGKYCRQHICGFPICEKKICFTEGDMSTDVEVYDYCRWHICQVKSCRNSIYIMYEHNVPIESPYCQDHDK